MRTGTKEKIRQIALRILNEEVYALQDNYSDEQIADLVTSIVSHFKFHSTTPCIGTFADGDLLIKVKNGLTGSSVSVSNNDSTGVSNSLAYIIQLREDENEEEVKEIIDMLDEAYCVMLDYAV